MAELRLTLGDAPTDVLVYLVDHGPASAKELLNAVVPPDVDEPGLTLARAVGLLVELGYVGAPPVEQWAATVAGVAAVRQARSSSAHPIEETSGE
jgi:hypothetical protein